jgi:hypothetical protein
LCCCVFILKVCSAQCTLLITCVYLPHSLTRHTSHFKPHTSHLTPHTSHLTPHTSHLTPHTSHLTPSHPQSQLYSAKCTVLYCNVLLITSPFLFSNYSISISGLHILSFPLNSTHYLNFRAWVYHLPFKF